ncbi:calmodulin, striated muscle-like [Glandiceps talaboti]
MGCIESCNEEEDSIPELTPKESAEIMGAFRMIDKDNSGYITYDELQEAMKNCGKDYSEEKVARMMRVADKNHDGRINYAEYVTMLKGY